MIRPEDITVVLQGDIRPDTLAAVASVRRHLPGAHLVLSTYAHPACVMLRERVDELVVSEDPGALPPTILSDAAPENNLNRQIVSTRAGLARARTPFALKLRSDALVEGRGFVIACESLCSSSRNCHRLVVPSYYTRHPDGISGYLFHVSDWFMFGATETLRRFWEVPPMSLEDATWYERNPHAPGSTATARRFRARYTQEQHLTVHYAKRLGYAVPLYHNERTPVLAREYKRFLARECVVDSPKALGIVLPKHAHVEKSLYQRLDCVSRADWLGWWIEHGDSGLSFSGRVPAGMGHNWRRMALALARAARHPIARGLLVQKRIRQEWARFQSVFSRNAWPTR